MLLTLPLIALLVAEAAVPPRPRPCQAYVRDAASRGGYVDHFIDYDGRFQHFDVTATTDAQEMAEYFRQSFAVDVHAAEAPGVITRAIEAWVAKRRQSSDDPAAAAAGCKVTPEPATPAPERYATLIFQLGEHDRNNNVEWISYLLTAADGGNDDAFSIKEVVWDEGRFTAFHDHAIIVYHTESCETVNMPLMQYLRGYDERNLAYGVVHLHDERIDGCRSHYPMSRFVLRNNGHPTFFRSEYLKHHILEIPIGYQNGVAATHQHQEAASAIIRPPSDRRYVWSWIGDTGSKPHRQSTIHQLREEVNVKLGIEDAAFMLHETSRWDDAAQLSRAEYTRILGDSIFCPSPIGTLFRRGNIMSGLGTMRTWEALEQGAIPVIEDWSEYHNMDGDGPAATQSGGGSGKSGNWTLDAMQSYLGRYGVLNATPPLPMVHHTWRDAVQVLSPLLKDPQRLHKLWVNIRAWYRAQKERTRQAVRSFVGERLWQSRAFKAAQEIGYCTVYVDGVWAGGEGGRTLGIYVNLPCFV